MVISCLVDCGQALGGARYTAGRRLFGAPKLTGKAGGILALRDTVSQIGRPGQWDNLPISPNFSMLRVRGP